MKISIDRMIALMGALREILAIIVPLLKKKENGTDKIEEIDAKSDSQQQSAEHSENKR